jgi:hypothetical protein
MTPAGEGRLAPGRPFPDAELRDHAGNRRRLSQLVAGDPAVLHFYRGWWCPKDQAFFRRLVRLQDDMEVAYARLISVVHRSYDGYWYWGRPSDEELRQDLRDISRAIRPDWEAPAR